MNRLHTSRLNHPASDAPDVRWKHMVRGTVALLLMLALLAGVAALAGAPLIGAQNSPTLASSAPIKLETLGQEVSAVTPDRALLLARRTFAPGSDSGAHPAPGPVVLYVDAGTVQFEVVRGAALVKRSGAPRSEPVAAGGRITLNTGDEVSYDQGVIHDVSNQASVAAVTLEARLNPRQSLSTPAH